MKKKILWISMMAPYDHVDHASGKTENYYLKNEYWSSDFDVTLLTLCKEYEVVKLDLDKYNIKNKIYIRKWKGIYGFIRRGIAWASKLNILNKYAGLTPCDISYGIRKMLDELYQEGYSPDCIVLQWTEILFMLGDIKKYYPDIPIVAVEEDVSYLGQFRRRESSEGLRKVFYNMKYEKVKRLELEYLNCVNLVVLNNTKDYRLIVKDGVNNEILVWSVFYQSLLNVFPQRDTKDIVYYGAMSREENWKSAEWFILNVMPLLEDEEIRFVIIGSNPNHRLYRYCSDRIIIKGYVDDISAELAKGLCLVAPLVLGAGIKVKIIEALSCGIPVLTNSIGIEGIPAVNGESYFHCEKPGDYADVIKKISEGKIDMQRLCEYAKDVVRNNFDYEESAERFAEKIKEIIKK